MDELTYIFTTNKCLRLKISLTKEFPVVLLGTKRNEKKVKFFLADVVNAEDLSGFISQFGKLLSDEETELSFHFRTIPAYGSQWFYMHCEKGENASGIAYATLMNVSDQMETVDVDPVINEYRNRHFEKVSALRAEGAALTDILDKEYLSKIQMPFKMRSGVYSAIFDRGNNLICTPNLKDTEFDLSSYAFMKHVNIRINHVIAASWVICSNKEENVERNYEMLVLLAETLSKLVNSLMLLFNETINSERANRMLSENVEFQILINSVYNYILEAKDAVTSLSGVMKIVGEYMNLDRVILYTDDKENCLLRFDTQWATETSPTADLTAFDYSRFEKTLEQLEIADIYHPSGFKHELNKFGVKQYVAANLKNNGERIGIILYVIYNEERLPKSQEIKMLKNVSQIISALLIRKQTDLKLENTSERMRYLAYNDPILDIPNRIKLDEDLEDAINNNKNGAILALKIANLRVFNELFGISYADMLLKSIAEYIKSLKNIKIELYKFTGNILSMLYYDCDENDARIFAESLLKRFLRPWTNGYNEHYLDTNIGISMFPSPSNTTDELYREISFALYYSTEYGSNHYTFYDRNHEKTRISDYHFTEELRACINNDMQGFTLLYQPMIDYKENAPMIYEVFVAWNNGERSLPAGNLISLAESLGFDIEIDQWVLNEATNFCKEMQKYDENFKISVNLTVRDIKSSVIIEVVRNALTSSGLSPDSLFLEIKEKYLTSSAKYLLPVLLKLKQIGVGLIVDDFGTDYMAPTMLRYSYIDIIKADFSLFENVFDEIDEILLDTTMKITKFVQKGLCVKRIENRAQLAALEKYNIKFTQGYLFAKPVPAKEILQECEKKETVTIN